LSPSPQEEIEETLAPLLSMNGREKIQGGWNSLNVSNKNIYVSCKITVLAWILGEENHWSSGSPNSAINNAMFILLGSVQICYSRHTLCHEFVRYTKNNADLD
jgi:hypothetical protein